MNWADMFDAEEQIGRLAISHMGHAMGHTVRVMVLPEGVDAIWGGPGNAPRNDDGVLVFGPTDSTNRKQDWLHVGPWKDDILAESARRWADREARYAEEVAKAEQRKAEKEARDLALLATYGRK